MSPWNLQQCHFPLNSFMWTHSLWKNHWKYLHGLIGYWDTNVQSEWIQQQIKCPNLKTFISLMNMINTILICEPDNRPGEFSDLCIGTKASSVSASFARRCGFRTRSGLLAKWTSGRIVSHNDNNIWHQTNWWRSNFHHLSNIKRLI